MLKKFFLIFTILFLALILRIYRLDEVPIELFGDEIDVGIQAYSILKTGQDYLGNGFPVMFQSFTEYRLPAFIYSAVPFVAVFGLNEWGVRLTSVFWGILGILGMFLLSQKLFNTKIGLLSALFLTASPWHLQYSRQGGIESVMLLTFLIFGLWCFLKGLEKYLWLIISVILFSLSIYIYPVAIVFILIIGMFLTAAYFRNLLKYGLPKLASALFIGAVILTPYLFLNIQGKAGERFSSISIWSDQTLIKDINERREKEQNSNIASIFHNKLLVYFYEASGNYLKSISTEFLFFKGDPNLRHSVGGMGELYFFEIITIVLGLLLLTTKTKNRIFIIGLLLISPIPASLTRDGGYHASRLITMLIPLMILLALGMEYLLQNFKNFKMKLILGFVFVLAFINVSYYFHRYYNDFSRDGWRFWQVGYKESVEYIKKIDKDYKRIYINNTYETALPRFLFWYSFDPRFFHNKFSGNLNQKNIVPGFDGFQYSDKYYFGSINSGNIESFLKKDELYMVSFRDETNVIDWRISPPTKLKVLKTVANYLNQPIFFIVTKND